MYFVSLLCEEVKGNGEVEGVDEQRERDNKGWDSSATIDGPRIYIPVLRYERGRGNLFTRTYRSFDAVTSVSCTFLVPVNR